MFPLIPTVGGFIVLQILSPQKIRIPVTENSNNNNKLTHGDL